MATTFNSSLSASVGVAQSFPPVSLTERNRGAHRQIQLLKVASYLTEPVCKVREYAYTFYILDHLYQTVVHKVTHVAYLAIGILVSVFLTPMLTPVGIGVRFLVKKIQENPFIYLQKAEKGKQLPPTKQISLASHNVCYMPAGYTITDGQVTPVSDVKRKELNLNALKQVNADINCLFEVPDIRDAEALSAALPEYPFLIPVAGVKAIGPSSMMYVASKYEIDEKSIRFIPFLKGEELTGWSQFSEKGFLSFDLKEAGNITVICTHLQHSEIPSKPTEEDRIARAKQMAKILAHIQQKRREGRTVILTGDLNQTEDELEQSLARYGDLPWQRDPEIVGKPTWGGDAWCARLTSKSPSGPLVLDYTLATGNVKSVQTQIVETGYAGDRFRKEAGSDHYLLHTVCTLKD